MNKRAFLFSFLAALLLLVPLTAQAEWQTVPLGFRLVNQGSPFNSTGIWARDSSLARFNGVITSNGGALDTTTSFSPRSRPISVGPSILGANVRGDSLLAGFLIFQQDTATTTDPTFSTVTMAIDGRLGGFGTSLETNQWTAIDTVSVGVTVGEGTVVVPVRCFGAFGKTVVAYPELRARTIAGVGVLFSARAYWRYWKDDK